MSLSDAPAVYERDGDIGTLTLNRPKVHNALSIELLADLRLRLAEVASEPPKVLIVTGAGRSFCAGMDLKQVLARPEAPLELLSSLSRCLLALRALPSVVIAKVNGAAIGGGCGLTCACDFAVTFESNVMGFPEVDLGVCPAVVAPWLARKIGHGRAREVLLLGGTFDGRRAKELGLVREAAADRTMLDAAVDSLAKTIATGGAMALRETKALLNTLDGSLDADLAQRAAERSAAVLATEEARVSLQRRLESR
ncbi:MAG: enoyl-CoA hydratase/isomerase family protein [Phycisphaeraceae bacterium]|nr:enoyl-CoA hydratase/isomerase family protein [Phycisphaeraceae bacterium]MCW5753865.1 enoyl-CoA hydratase/isomerase family protein [Phycisphaeraceae bacterium]